MDLAVLSDTADRAAAVQAAHNRLLTGDRVASDELFQLLLPDLVARLEKRWRKWKHTDVINDAAVDAFLSYVEAPERYEPGRASLLSWLELAAHGDLTNLYRSRKHRAAIETEGLSEVVELGGQLPRGVNPVGAAAAAPPPDDPDRLDTHRILRRIREVCPDERERKLIWAHWVEGEKSWDQLARIIGVDGLPPEQRRRKVKSACDVARRKLRRLGLTDGTE